MAATVPEKVADWRLLIPYAVATRADFAGRHASKRPYVLDGILTVFRPEPVGATGQPGVSIGKSFLFNVSYRDGSVSTGFTLYLKTSLLDSPEGRLESMLRSLESRQVKGVIGGLYGSDASKKNVNYIFIDCLAEAVVKIGIVKDGGVLNDYSTGQRPVE